jgi:hypothetical protein
VLPFWPTPARSDRPPSPSPVETIPSISRLITTGMPMTSLVRPLTAGASGPLLKLKRCDYHAYQFSCRPEFESPSLGENYDWISLSPTSGSGIIAVAIEANHAKYDQTKLS